MVCVRSAWLTLGALSVPLENVAAGYFCSSLDLGYPDVRDVVNNRPDQDGVDDRTAYMGSRVVSANISALAGAGAQIDAVASSFAPFMVPNVRPVLHYILDRPGTAERTMTLRASGYSWPIVGPYERDIQLQFVAADPVALDPVEQTSTVWSGSSTAAGRTYPLTFNRIYPPGGSSPTTGIIISAGDLPIRPRIRIYGPITQPSAFIQTTSTAIAIRVRFLAAFTIGAGHYVDVSVADRSAYLDGDRSQSVIASIDWYRSIWGVLTPNVRYSFLLQGSTTSGVTQAVATWHDRYVT